MQKDRASPFGIRVDIININLIYLETQLTFCPDFDSNARMYIISKFVIHKLQRVNKFSTKYNLINREKSVRKEMQLVFTRETVIIEKGAERGITYPQKSGKTESGGLTGGSITKLAPAKKRHT